MKPLPTRRRVACECRVHSDLVAWTHAPCRNYVNQATALAQNLTYASGNTLIMRADYKTVLSASGPGRNRFVSTTPMRRVARAD
jgi:hypothetical protein